MSAIADFRLIETSKLEELVNTTAKNYQNFLNSHSKQLADFTWSGYVFADLLIFLEEKGILLMKSPYDNIAEELGSKGNSTIVILTHEHKTTYLNDLSPDKFSLEELTAFNKEFSEQDDIELAKAELEGIKLLHENIGQIVNENYVVILSVG